MMAMVVAVIAVVVLMVEAQHHSGIDLPLGYRQQGGAPTDLRLQLAP